MTMTGNGFSLVLLHLKSGRLQGVVLVKRVYIRRRRLVTVRGQHDVACPTDCQQPLLVPAVLRFAFFSLEVPLLP